MMLRAAGFVVLVAIATMVLVWAELRAFWPSGTVHAGWVPVVVISLSCTVLSVIMLSCFIRRVLPRGRLPKPGDQDSYYLNGH
jgi:hypothetical protein